MTSAAERRAFMARSLADLEAEHAAGDLADGDYTRLKADYERRLAALDGKTAPRVAAPQLRPWWQRVVLGVGVTAFAVLAGVLMAQAAGRRGTGDTITGGNTGGSDGGGTPEASPTSLPDALAQCFDLVGSEAFDCYIAYTRAQPDDPDGFLYFGLYSVNEGLRTDTPELVEGGETFLRQALRLDPANVDARVNLAVVLERTGRDTEAREELARLDGVEIPADLQTLVDFVRDNLAEGAPTTTSG